MRCIAARALALVLLAGLLVVTCARSAEPSSTEVPIQKHEGMDQSLDLKEKPLTAVVVTQCNLLVVVYLTTKDGRLLRYDSTSKVPAEQLVALAYTANRSQRVEVACDESGPRGVVGYEKHDPI